MPGPSDTRNREFWLARAGVVRARVNLAWWLETLTAPLAVTSLLCAAVILWIRADFPAIDLSILAAAIGGIILLLAAVCYLFASRKFERTEESIVRIEASMRMRNALSAALGGAGPWPAPITRTDDGLRWRWPRLILPLLASLTLLTAGLWIPVSKKQDLVFQTPEQPQSWKQLAEELDFLTKEQAVDQTYLEETRKRLDELKSQNEQQWFSHSSLEATDSLQKAHRAEIGRVQHDLEMANAVLGALEKSAGSAAQAELDKIRQEFDQALQNLQAGAMKPNPELLARLAELDLKDLGNIPPEQLRQLQELMRANADALAEANGEAAEWDGDLLAIAGEAEGGPPGAGGINRGPGHVPGLLGEESERLDTGDLASLEAKDLSKSAPGDLLDLEDGEHDVDLAPTRLTRGGEIRDKGAGGDRVWRESLDPDEQRVMKRFFE